MLDLYDDRTLRQREILAELYNVHIVKSDRIFPTTGDINSVYILYSETYRGMIESATLKVDADIVTILLEGISSMYSEEINSFDEDEFGLWIRLKTMDKGVMYE